MANSQSTMGCTVLNTVGGYAGPMSVWAIMACSGGTAGTITVRGDNSATGPILAVIPVPATAGLTNTVYLNKVACRGVYLATDEFPSGGYAVVYSD